MNILLINHYAGSPYYGMEFRPFHMAKEWVSMGHNVLIIGGSFSHLRKKQPEVSCETIDGIEYVWVKVNKYKGNGVLRIVSMALFVSKLYINFRKYLNDFNPDIVIASSTYPIDIYPAKHISDKYQAKLIYEVHDLWPLSPIELGGMSPKNPFIRIMQAGEDYCYKHSDAVVCMLPCAEPHMKQRGLKAGKFNYIPNGIVLSDWENPEDIPAEHKQLLETLRKKGEFIVGFAGAHGIANSLQSAIDAVAQLKDENVSLVLVGTGQEKENLIQYVKKHNFNNIYFLPPIGKLSMPTLLKQMDLLYVGLQKQSLFRYGISPNKIFDYMMAAKPIVQAIEAGNNLVEEAECGLYAEPENNEAIKNAILKIKNLPMEDRREMGLKGQAFVKENHTYGVLSTKFIEVMTKIL